MVFLNGPLKHKVWKGPLRKLHRCKRTLNSRNLGHYVKDLFKDSFFRDPMWRILLRILLRLLVVRGCLSFAVARRSRLLELLTNHYVSHPNRKKSSTFDENPCRFFEKNAFFSLSLRFMWKNLKTCNFALFYCGFCVFEAENEPCHGFWARIWRTRSGDVMRNPHRQAV